MIKRRKFKSLFIGQILISFLVILAVISFFWTPHNPEDINILKKLANPTIENWLGTDPYGRDIFSILMAGTSSTLFTAFIAVIIGTMIGTMLGISSCYSHEYISTTLSKINESVIAFPALLIALIITAIWNGGVHVIITAIAIYNIPIFYRLSRAQTLNLSSSAFIMASQALGQPTLYIIIKHVFPNVLPIIIIHMSSQIAFAILAESGFSYLGLGIQPPHPSWGRMLHDSQTFLFLKPQLAIYPGVMIFIAILAFNLLSDGLRDFLDPHMRKREKMK